MADPQTSMFRAGCKCNLVTLARPQKAQPADAAFLQVHAAATRFLNARSFEAQGSLMVDQTKTTGAPGSSERKSACTGTAPARPDLETRWKKRQTNAIPSILENSQSE